jgi:uncharacterized membrane protein YoaK (UPF0700 family)
MRDVDEHPSVVAGSASNSAVSKLISHAVSYRPDCFGSRSGQNDFSTNHWIPVRHVLSLALVAGYVDALGFFDLNEIYTAAMTGNTVQLGVTVVREEWPRLAVAGATLGAFFCGGLFSSFICRRLPHPAILLVIMAPPLLAAQAVRLDAQNPAAIELSLLAMVIAMQGQTVSRFAGIPFRRSWSPIIC